MYFQTNFDIVFFFVVFGVHQPVTRNTGRVCSWQVLVIYVFLNVMCFQTKYNVVFLILVLGLHLPVKNIYISGINNYLTIFAKSIYYFNICFHICIKPIIHFIFFKLYKSRKVLWSYISIFGPLCATACRCGNLMN